MTSRTVSVAEGLLVLCAGPFVAAACLAWWWLIGNQDEPLGGSVQALTQRSESMGSMRQ